MKTVINIITTILVTAIMTVAATGSAFLYAFLVGVALNLFYPIDVLYIAKMFAGYIGFSVLLVCVTAVSAGVDFE